MRPLALILLLCVSAIAQDQTPQVVGGGPLPPEFGDSHDLHSIQTSQVAALKEAVIALRQRYEGRLLDIGIVLATRRELLEAQLDASKEKTERLDAIQDALIESLKTWQRTNELRSVGIKGGEPDAEGWARAEVFRFREMWLEEKEQQEKTRKEDQLYLVTPAFPTDIGTKKFPSGLTEDASIEDVWKHRLEALEQVRSALMAKYMGGLADIQFVQYAERDLALAKLEMSTSKGERLAHIREAFESALKTWQRAYELGRIKRRGGEPDSEGAARAAVFMYRVMWLKENSNDANVPGESKPAVPPKEDFSEQFGIGKFPDGLVGVFDLEALKRSRMDAALQRATALWDRYIGGLTYISFLIDAQKELLNAQLDSTSDREQRLKYIEDALNASIALWRRTEELRKVARKGGEPDQVSLARAGVLRYRAMWLKEKGLPKKVEESVQCKILRLLPGIEAIAIIEIETLDQSKDFRDISEGLNTKEFAKKVAFSASTEWKGIFEEGPHRSFLRVLETHTDRLTIVKLRGDKEWCFILEGSFEEEEILNAVNAYCTESGYSEFATNRAGNLICFANEGIREALILENRKTLVLGSASGIKNLFERIVAADFKESASPLTESAIRYSKAKDAAVFFALNGSSDVVIFDTPTTGDFVQGRIIMSGGKILLDMSFERSEFQKFDRTFQRLKANIASLYGSLTFLLQILQEPLELAEDINRLRLKHDGSRILVTGSTNTSTLKSFVSALLSYNSAK